MDPAHTEVAPAAADATWEEEVKTERPPCFLTGKKLVEHFTRLCLKPAYLVPNGEHNGKRRYVAILCGDRNHPEPGSFHFFPAYLNFGRVSLSDRAITPWAPESGSNGQALPPAAFASFAAVTMHAGTVGTRVEAPDGSGANWVFFTPNGEGAVKVYTHKEVIRTSKLGKDYAVVLRTSAEPRHSAAAGPHPDYAWDGRNETGYDAAAGCSTVADDRKRAATRKIERSGSPTTKRVAPTPAVHP